MLLLLIKELHESEILDCSTPDIIKIISSHNSVPVCNSGYSISSLSSWIFYFKDTFSNILCWSTALKNSFCCREIGTFSLSVCLSVSLCLSLCLSSLSLCLSVSVSLSLFLSLSLPLSLPLSLSLSVSLCLSLSVSLSLGIIQQRNWVWYWQKFFHWKKVKENR